MFAARLSAAEGGSICENLCHLWLISSLLAGLPRNRLPGTNGYRRAQIPGWKQLKAAS
jgi:hypothetical protein